MNVPCNQSLFYCQLFLIFHYCAQSDHTFIYYAQCDQLQYDQVFVSYAQCDHTIFYCALCDHVVRHFVTMHFFIMRFVTMHFFIMHFLTMLSTHCDQTFLLFIPGTTFSLFSLPSAFTHEWLYMHQWTQYHVAHFYDMWKILLQRIIQPKTH